MRELKTTGEKGLDHSLLPMRLYHKAKKLGVWDPKDIDFTQDKETWQTFTDEEKEASLRLGAMFQAGEEAVTRDLLPLIRVISMEGRLEEELYLTTFLFEEAKHTEVFRRFLDEVVGGAGDLTIYHQSHFKKIFYEYLPQAMERLIDDPSPEAQAEASVTYNMVVEGILAESGYHAFYTALQGQLAMPGMFEAVTNLKRDEARHISYGSYLLQRLISEHDHIWDVVVKRMELLLPHAIGVVDEIFGTMDPFPFDLKKDDIVAFAMKQFQTRMEVLRRARGKTPDEIYSISEKDVGLTDE
ncbi:MULTISPECIES: R2-like ligand-binding oxidase [Thermoactinomyces]|jgi:ribonucleoside-diphosphate reductase beta chain|uniref:R2-like ligand binding oxidase n=1 Tax=Thermoactinomyces vulgaris TaxID=2026 RepID=A0ABS0QEI3_THEVU|nr:MULTISPECIES: R2-like ligand-binding oxidase [Thermoactinomyces]KFZ41200.1 ribonucleotide-diphosphate reductase [Thermoactinomyces sp. Gus2-1]KYQ87622.1 ribonucleotide-diphosphate reductase [Thermoactinomyces sp. AS95]MBA4550177.1 R2-like ligand-binding oxidase [Thermoactinomyces vulgaris]MBA4595588.1 R2-like ligand-binding oxidase [Thermoactinomyces vulgaris]MBH8582061.1 R2-like ligand-binding oxidase [Thermoactinomyces sp. CICC 10735]